MDCSKKTIAMKIMLCALIFIGMNIKLSSCRLCDKEWYEYCTLKDVSIRTNSEASNFVFPNEKAIRFKEANIPSSAKILFGRIPDVVEKMRISFGIVPEVYIKQTIYQFYAYECKLQEVIIDQTGTYELRKLEIWHNLLRSVPKNISKLTNLEHFSLSNNKIETVSMDHFEDLLNLRYLQLASNSIVRVDTSVPLNLPKLEELYLNVNNLQYLSITFWNFPNLRTFTAHSNMLRNILNFPRKFPKLYEVLIDYNQWSCAWLESVKSELSKIVRDEEKCSGKSVNKICCQDYSIDDNSFASFEEPIAFGLLQISENLQKAIHQIDEKISKLATDTKVLIENKMSTVDRTIQEIKEEVKAKDSNVKKELQNINAKLEDDRKQSQEGIDRIDGSVSKLTTEIQEKFKSVESSIEKKLSQINVRVLENQASIADDRKKFQEGIDQIGENNSKLITDTRALMDYKMGDVSITIQGIKEDVKSVESGVKNQVIELQKITANDRKQLHQASEKLATEIQAKVKSMESSIRTEVHQELTQISVKVDGNRASVSESISKLTSDTKVLIDNKMSDVTRTVQESRDEIKLTQSSVREQNHELEKLIVKVDENRASAVDDRKLLEEKISNSDNQNKEEIKWVKQKVNENRALINDVVEDLYLEELEKEEL